MICKIRDKESEVSEQVKFLKIEFNFDNANIIFDDIQSKIENIIAR